MSGADKRRTARRAFVPDKEWTREEVDAFIEHNPIGFSVYCGRHEPRDFIATFRRTTNRFDGTPTWAPHPFWIDGTGTAEPATTVACRQSTASVMWCRSLGQPCSTPTRTILSASWST